jgi:DNA phosphorothioation-dependent restriction protein DptG
MQDCPSSVVYCCLYGVVIMADHLSILNWNVRGLNPPARREAVKDMLQSHKAKVACLQETKLASVCRQTALEFLGQALDGYQYLPAEGTKGGILLGWNSDFVRLPTCCLKNSPSCNTPVLL